MLFLVILFLVFVVAPFVCGFFPRGSEWAIRPTMYLNWWLLTIANLGYKVKIAIKGML